MSFTQYFYVCCLNFWEVHAFELKILNIWCRFASVCLFGHIVWSPKPIHRLLKVSGYHCFVMKINHLLWKTKTSVSFLGIYNWNNTALVFVLIFSLVVSFVFLIFIHSKSLNWTSLGQWNGEKYPPIRERESFNWNSFLSPTVH